MDLLGQSEALERIGLIAKYVCVEESSARERQIALLWINELVETMRHDVATKKEKPQERGLITYAAGAAFSKSSAIYF
ncbi:hypothetical protein AGJ35_09315 [Cronobacter dublinensis subsp. dublinensis]|nr:hypothetical protein [Cronobacter dublinensis subsp. dublinensis]EGT5734454.1 hypothetical protein [Cronobacter dublinensis subsp. dublinensis]